MQPQSWERKEIKTTILPAPAKKAFYPLVEKRARNGW